MIAIKILSFFILYLLLFLLGLILVLLTSPIKAEAFANNNAIHVKGSYIFGIIKIQYDKNNEMSTFLIRVFGLKINSQNKESGKKNNITKKEKKKKRKGRKKYGLPGKRVIVLAFDLVCKLIRKIAPKKLSVKLVVGLDDPYYTSIMQMASQVIFIPLNRIKSYDFYVKPEYLDLVFKYECSGDINFSVMSLILPVLDFIFKKPIRKYLGILKFIN